MTPEVEYIPYGSSDNRSPKPNSKLKLEIIEVVGDIDVVTWPNGADGKAMQIDYYEHEGNGDKLRKVMKGRVVRIKPNRRGRVNMEEKGLTYDADKLPILERVVVKE